MIGSFLASVLYKFKTSRQPDFVIPPEQWDDPYLRRWWIIPRNGLFNIYLHHMLKDDDDRAPHDHPYWSLSLCLFGHIREKELIDRDKGDYRINEINAGDWRWRSATMSHILQLPKGEAWTLFITGPRIRDWGFHCKKKWISQELFHRQGGCGEYD